MKLRDARLACASVTADQWGLITSAQATQVGVDGITVKRLVDDGHLEAVRHGVYIVTGAGETPHQHTKAAWLWLNRTTPAWQRPRLDPDGGVPSHRTAAQIHGLGDMTVPAIEITVPRTRKARDPALTLRRGTLAEHDVELLDGLPVTTVERTIVDLLSDHVDGSHAGEILATALHQNQVDPDVLAARIGTYSRRYGVRGDGSHLITHLLAHVRGPGYGLAARRRAQAVTLPPQTPEELASLTAEAIANLQKLSESAVFAATRDSHHALAALADTTSRLQDAGAANVEGLRDAVDEAKREIRRSPADARPPAGPDRDTARR